MLNKNNVESLNEMGSAFLLTGLAYCLALPSKLSAETNVQAVLVIR